MEDIKFRCQIKETKARSLVSGDKSYRVLLDGCDNAMLEMGAIPATATIEVSVKIISE
jgi:hypothetical protein